MWVDVKSVLPPFTESGAQMYDSFIGSKLGKLFLDLPFKSVRKASIVATAVRQCIVAPTSDVQRPEKTL